MKEGQVGIKKKKIEKEGRKQRNKEKKKMGEKQDYEGRKGERGKGRERYRKLTSMKKQKVQIRGVNRKNRENI